MTTLYTVSLYHPNYPKLHGMIAITLHDDSDNDGAFCYCTAENMGCSRNYRLSHINAIYAFAYEHGARVVGITKAPAAVEQAPAAVELVVEAPAAVELEQAPLASDLLAKLNRHFGLATSVVRSPAENLRRIRFILDVWERQQLPLEYSERASNKWQRLDYDNPPMDFSSYCFRIEQAPAATAAEVELEGE